MAAFVKFQNFVEDLGKGTHQLHAAGHTLKVYATNATPNVATHAVKADIAEITAQNGYPSGGSDIQNDYTEASGTASCTGVDVVWTASSGSFGPFRYVVLYNDTPASDPLIGYWDYGSAVTINDGETFTTDFSSSVFTVS